ncbi:DNA ligase D [Bdellovibrio sp. qaytius]|nr:DNA ligase D [Bdellovibrio sp. qaytius]
MGLQEYRQKRDFKKTLEPRGRKISTKGQHIFVIQKHAASHLHYDLRLELDGVLKSWAIPKGPSLNPNDKRLAVEVEDHPMDYAYFEGSIPLGEYGGGDVIVWDRGVWIPPKGALKALEKGHLEFELRGEKLSGKFMLVRTRRMGSSKKSQWLLIKRHDQFVDEDHDILKKDKSVITGLSLTNLERIKKKTKLIRSKLPAFIEPQLALLAETPPQGDNWIHEIKLDGYRTFCHKQKSNIKLLTRSGLDWTSKYKFIEHECKKIKADSAMLDGEIVWTDNNGVSHFQGLQNSLENHHSDELFYYVFDLLHLNGVDLRDTPLLQRKMLLKKLLVESGSKKILFSDFIKGDGKNVLKSACHLNLEGIVSKDGKSTYQSGRNKNWIKSKCIKLQEFVIGGYTFQNKNKSLGSLLMGAYNAQGEFQYLGRVGTGFNSSESTKLLEKLRKLKSEKSFFTKGSPTSTAQDLRRELSFVKPNLVAQIEFGAWTDEKILRHASFKGLRLDKKAKSVTIEEPALKKTTELSDIKLTNPDKVLFPKAKLTKKQLYDYYKTIHKWMMPYVDHRPLSLLRGPNGVGKTCFFQKHAETNNVGLKAKKLTSGLKNKTEEVLYVDSLKGILEMVQMATLEIHSRGCHIHNIDQPDLIVFDLDPAPNVTFAKVKEAALALKDLLDRLKLKSFALVSGGKGLHLHVPIEAKYNFDEVKHFAKIVCEQLVNENPESFTTDISKAKRSKKIFLDYLRNGFGATAITPYSVRAQTEATVAFPITWPQLKKVTSAKEFTVDKVLKILKKSKDPWTGYFRLKQKLALLDKLNSQLH